jgi:hypothetical protein
MQKQKPLAAERQIAVFVFASMNDQDVRPLLSPKQINLLPNSKGNRLII